MSDINPQVNFSNSKNQVVLESLNKLESNARAMNSASSDPKENGGSMLQLEESSPLRETTSDPFRKPRWLRNASELSLIIGSMITFSVVVTIALIAQIVAGATQVTPHAVIISEDKFCSEVGLSFMKKHDKSTEKGTSISVDAAIVTALCLSVKNPHLGGLGGGGFMMIQQQHLTKEDTLTINFREMSPAATNATTFTVQKDTVQKVETIAVPGFIKGMAKAHGLFGSVTWGDLFDPIIKLAKDGITISDDLANAVENLDVATASESVKTFKYNIKTKKKGDTLKQPELAKTLEDISKSAELFYKDSIASDLLKDISGSQIRMKDLHNYKVETSYDNLEVVYPDNKILGAPPPASSFTILSILNTMLAYGTDITSEYVQNLQSHRMLESMKYANADLSTLGDESSSALSLLNSTRGNTIKESINDNSTKASLSEYLNGVNLLDLNRGGEQHVSIIGSDGFVVTISMGIGSEFGSQIMTGGFFLNNAMLDFSWEGKSKNYQSRLAVPPANKLAANKRPMSAMSPVLVIPRLSKCGLYFAFDNDLGSVSVPDSGLTEVLVRNLTQHVAIANSISSPRIGQVFYPYQVAVENGVEKTLTDDLAKKGHKIQALNEEEKIGKCNAIEYNTGHMMFYNDQRDSNNSGVQY